MVGAGGLGNDVLASIQRLDIGLSFESGLSVVLLAIVLDRITESLAGLLAAVKSPSFRTSGSCFASARQPPGLDV